MFAKSATGSFREDEAAMNFRVLAPIALCAFFAWGCSSPDLNAAEPAAPATASPDASTPMAVASAPTADALSVARAGPTATVTTAAPAANPTTTATTNPLLTRTVKILSLGDSMTAGNEIDPLAYRSYRGRLYQMLVSAGYQVDFVGTQQRLPFIGGDPDHDGYGGAWIGPGGQANNLADKLPGILAAVDPDIIILAFGWNSVYKEPSLAGAKYRDFVNRLAAAKPNAHLVVATLSPQRGETEAGSNASVDGYASFNAVARSLASASPIDRIHLADYASAGFQASDYWDVIHWMQPGADRAAQVLYQTIVNGPLKR